LHWLQLINAYFVELFIVVLIVTTILLQP